MNNIIYTDVCEILYGLTNTDQIKPSQQALYNHKVNESSYMESAMLYYHVSIVAQNTEIKHWLQIGTVKFL